MPPTAYTDDFQNLELTITRFIPTLVPVQQLEATLPEQKHAFLTNHTLAHAAVVHLYYPFGTEDPTSYQKCLRAARAIVTIIKHLSEVDFEFLDPIIGVSRFASQVEFSIHRITLALLGHRWGYSDTRIRRH